LDQLPEVDHAHGAHAHGTGHKWLDIIVAVSAIFISVVSLVVSIEHGRTMAKMVDQNEKMVEASTMPVLVQDSTFNSDPTDPKKAKIKVVVKNSGIGPAMIDRFEVTYKGRSYDASQSSLVEILKACCAQSLPKTEVTLLMSASSVTGTVLPARESITMLSIAPQTKELFEALQGAQSDLKFNACYCSVLNECWVTDFTNQRPKPVAECKVAAGEKLW
jgi:hypothetical protein